MREGDRVGRVGVAGDPGGCGPFVNAEDIRRQPWLVPSVLDECIDPQGTTGENRWGYPHDP